MRGRSLGAADPRSLSDLQVNADPQGRFRITKTDTTDPSRSVLLMRVQFESLTKEPLHLYVVYDPKSVGQWRRRFGVDCRECAGRRRRHVGHAQFIRLAWSIDAGRPVERPALVSCRYGGPCDSAR